MLDQLVEALMTKETLDKGELASTETATVTTKKPNQFSASCQRQADEYRGVQCSKLGSARRPHSI